MIPNITLAAPTSADPSFSQTAPSPVLRPCIPTNPPQPLTVVRPTVLSWRLHEALAAQLQRSGRSQLGSEKGRKNVFGDTLDSIDNEEWFDRVVNQPQKKKSPLLRSVPMVKGLEESLPKSSDSNDRPIGAIIAKVIKKLDAAKAKKKRLLWQLRIKRGK